MNDHRQDLFDIWAPRESPWSAWAKPVLFTQPGNWPHAAQWTAPELRMNGPLKKIARAGAHPRQAVVVDLPALDTMQAAAQLALAGYRPVPLFNTTTGRKAIVDVDDILNTIAPVAEIIRLARLDDSAPPAFLLDAQRQPANVNSTIDAGKFDNRWLVFPQDFPSAEFLRKHRIDSVVVCQRGLSRVAEDLQHVLARWQGEGLRIYCAPTDDYGNGNPQLLNVTKPPGYRSWLRRLLVLLKLRRNSAGGFGAVIPEPGSGGGFS